jgi:predicted RNase H-like nuclease (RuvC/YqgF family)
MPHDPSFIVAIVMICTGGWLINNWIRAKHGYALEDEWGGKTERKETAESRAETERLKSENRELHGKVEAMQDRLVVLEKIVTDRGYTLAQEIEALREVRTADHGTGVPLGIAKKERV